MATSELTAEQKAKNQSVADYITRLNGQDSSAQFPGIKYTNIAATPKFFKANSFLDQGLHAFIKVTIRIPPVDESKEEDINIFEIPYNHVQSFTYNVTGAENSNQAEIRLMDVSNTMTELLMIRFLTMSQSPYFLGSPRVKIQFGWVRPYRKFIKKVEEKLFFKQEIEGPIVDIESDFTESGVALVLKVNIDPVTILGSLGQLIRPYNVLGPVPLVNFAIESLLRSIDNIFDKKVDAALSSAILTAIDSNSASTGKIPQFPKVQQFLDDLELKFGIKGPKDKFEIVKSLINYYNKDQNNSVSAVRDLLASADEFTANASVNVDQLKPDRNTQFASFIDKFNKLKNDKDLQKVLIRFLPRLSEYKVHPWVAFAYLVRMMRLQIADLKIKFKDRKTTAIEVVPLILLRSDDIIGLSKSDKDLVGEYLIEAKARSEGKVLKEEAELLDNSEFIKADSVTVDIGRTWDDLIKQVLTKVRIQDRSSLLPSTQDQKKPTNPPSKLVSVKMISAENVNPTTQTVEQQIKNSSTQNKDGKSYFDNPEEGDVQGLKNQNILRILDLITQVEVNNPDSKPNDNQTQKRKQYDDFKKFIIDKQKQADISGFFYIIVSEENAGTIFSDENWQNRVINTYSFRFKKDVDRDVFLSGRRIMTEGYYPDVISFKPKFNLWSATRASFSQLIEAKFTNGNLQMTQTDDLEKQKKESDQKIKQREDAIKRLQDNKQLASEENIQKQIDSENQQKSEEQRKKDVESKRAQAMSSAYPIGGNLEFYKQNYPTNASQTDDAILTKKSIVNFRKRIALSAQELPIDIEVLGEPAFDLIVSQPNNLLLIKAYNNDGSESMFSGVYSINALSHHIEGGSFKTSIQLMNASYGSNTDPYGYLDYVLGKDSVKTSVKDTLLASKK